MLGADSITQQDVKTRLTVGMEVESSTGFTSYTIKAIGDANVTVGLKDSTSEYKPSYREIVAAYQKKMWDGGQVKGNDPYASAIAKYLFETPNLEHLKLVQFHPSYSYEDFVRGIVAKPNEDGSGVLYEAENKLLGKFTQLAHENYLNHNKPSEEVSRDQWFDEAFKDFVEMIENEISKAGKFQLNEHVYIYKVENQLFRYTGDNWAITSRRRMKFSDLKLEYLADVQVRQDIKKLPGISAEAREEATYGLIMVKKLQQFLNSRKPFSPDANASEPLRSYVLIIDEINRANLSSVLGELIYALEYRDEKVDSMYEVDGSNKLLLKPNLYIIGTMNTADRSVGHIDYAIRRRFAFVDVLPEVLSTDFETALFEKVSSLFVKDLHASKMEPSDHLSSEFKFKDVWLGHSYFIKKSNVDTRIRLKYEIIPILEEYIKDGVLKDTEEVEKIIAELETALP